jgi:hypothetical protein
MNQKPSLNYPMQFALLIGLMGVFIVISGVLVAFLGSQLMHVSFGEVGSAISKPGNVNIARFLNTLASVLIFLLPALILARKISNKAFTQLGFNSTIGFRQIIPLLLIMVAGILLSGALGDLNEKIPLPAALYAKAKALEEEYKASMMAMASMKTLFDYVLSLLVLAAAPALFEEVLFRGGFQQVFIGWTKNKWAGIIITSVLFSAFHFSYFGFLPRLALGIILGLVFFYSKNIWLNIFLHFLNNAMVVTQLYMASRMGKPVDKTLDENIPMWIGIIALLLLLVIFRTFKKESEAVWQAKEKDIYSSPENIVS